MGWWKNLSRSVSKSPLGDVYRGVDNLGDETLKILGQGQKDTAPAPPAGETPQNKALRESLTNSLGQVPGNLAQEKKNLSQESQYQLGQGLNQTKENYNRRGLLYSGMRQGAEQKVRGAVASTYQKSLNEAEKDSANLMDQRKQAIASLGLASQEQALNSANQAFDMATKNSVARQQAFQQFGQGLGMGAGYLYSKYGTTPNQANVTPIMTGASQKPGLLNDYNYMYS